MSSIADRIDSFFIEMEWPFARIDDHLWETAFQGDIQLHRIFISHDEEDWVSFRSPVAAAPKGECASNLYAHLLRLNSLIPLTKFCIMDDGAVFALIDLPTSDLDYSEFRTALTTLVNHVDAYDNEIVKICEEPGHVSSLHRAAATA